MANEEEVEEKGRKKLMSQECFVRFYHEGLILGGLNTMGIQSPFFTIITREATNYDFAWCASTDKRKWKKEGAARDRREEIAGNEMTSGGGSWRSSKDRKWGGN